MNQRSSAMTARRKTRLVVNSGRIRVGEEVEEGWDREKRRWGGANMESVPVPVL